MQAFTFWKTVTVDDANLLDHLITLLKEHRVRFCVIGGQGVNAYVEPLVSLDLDVVIAAEQIDEVEALLAREFRIEHFPHSLNISRPGSDLRVQIQKDPRYADFVPRATARRVLGVTLPVATVEDLVRGKVWAAQDQTRRASKRQKDLADIARLIEAYPALRPLVPPDILARLV
ncbi:MAG: nucleotidyl transferase AbiEii/AbiGii toxin family protein [Nitrospirota bacterium]